MYLINTIFNIVAPLTEEEVAAIDAAGAKGPPVTLRSMSPHLLVRRLWLPTSSLAILGLLVYYWVVCMGVHMFAA